MKKWFKRGLFALVFFIIVALIGAAVFLLTFDPNAYKTKVEQLVYERYQRHLTIDGDIELSLFPRIGLAVEQVSLSDHESDTVFAAVDSARFAVAVWPLLWDKLVVDHVALSGAKIWLKRDDQGEFNFTDLLQRESDSVVNSRRFSPLSSAQADTALVLHPTKQTEFQIDIAGLDLKSGELHISDEKSQTQMRVLDVELSTGRMTFGQPFDVIFKGALQGDQPVADAILEGQAVMQLEPHLKRYVAQRFNLSLNGSVGPYKATNAVIRGGLELLTLTKDLKAQNIEISTQGSWQDPHRSLNKINFSLQMAQLNLKQNLSLITEKLQLRANATVATTGQTEHKLELAIDVPRLNLEPDLVQAEPMAVSFKQSQDAAIFGINGRLKGLSGTLQQIDLEQAQVDIVGKNDQVAWKIATTTAAQWNSDVRSLQLSNTEMNLHLEDDRLEPNPANANLTGQATWWWADKKGDFTGLWQSANTHATFSSVLRYQDGWHVGAQIEAQDVDLRPWLPLAKNGSTVTPKTVTAKNPNLKTPMLFEQINWLTVEVDLALNAKQVLLPNYELQQVQIKAQQKDQQIQLNSFDAQWFGAQFSATGSWQPLTAQTRFKAQIKKANLADLSKAMSGKNWVSGQADIHVDLHTQGRTALAQRANLTGEVALKAKNTQVMGWDFWQHLSSSNEAVRNVFAGQVQAPNERYDAKQSTTFNQLEAKLEFTQGQGQLKQLKGQAEGMTIQAEPHSYVDLVNKQIDLDLRFDLQKKSIPEPYAFLSSYAEHPLFVWLSGSWSAPYYRLQWQRLAHSSVKEAIDHGLLSLLGRADLGALLLQQSQPTKATAPEGAAKAISNTLKDLLKK